MDVYPQSNNVNSYNSQPQYHSLYNHNPNQSSNHIQQNQIPPLIVSPAPATIPQPSPWFYPWPTNAVHQNSSNNDSQLTSDQSFWESIAGAVLFAAIIGLIMYRYPIPWIQHKNPKEPLMDSDVNLTTLVLVVVAVFILLAVLPHCALKNK